MSNSRLAEILEERKYVLEYVEGTDADSKPLFAYVLMKKACRDLFRKTLAAGDTNVSDFGVVIAYGNHPSPPAGFESKVLAALGTT